MSSYEDSDRHHQEYGVLPEKLAGGPQGLGDPDDRSLRKVEVEIMIPKKMREKAKLEKCTKEVEEFTDCCKASGLLMVVKCRKENSSLKSCLTHWYQDSEFKKLCTEEYLQERAVYRQTGVRKKFSRKESTTF